MSEIKISNSVTKKSTKKSSTKKSTKKESGLNIANSEKLDNKQIIEIKKDIIDIHFESFTVSNNLTSNLITKAFGKESTILTGRAIDFFYSDKLDMNLPYQNVLRSSIFGLIRELDVSKYIVNIKSQLRDALNINKILKGFAQSITYLDQVTDPDIYVTMPRYQKMKRLECLYDTLIHIGLTLIHNYYWVNICENEKSIDNSLKDAIILSTPTILNLKKEFENIVRLEYQYSADEEKIFMLTR
jgi:hypothetical protein